MSSFIFTSFENNYTEILAQDLQAWRTNNLARTLQGTNRADSLAQDLHGKKHARLNVVYCMWYTVYDILYTAYCILHTACGILYTASHPATSHPAALSCRTVERSVSIAPSASRVE